ncbi:hypothetical protein [Longispora albida]|uniref:hypothetical protein n=1 Tax=Longispora albida TaxID=203523 RepID=UPI000361489D|nr:hypothetical protein [Longispora albida]
MQGWGTVSVLACSGCVIVLLLIAAALRWPGRPQPLVWVPALMGLVPLVFLSATGFTGGQEGLGWLMVVSSVPHVAVAGFALAAARRFSPIRALGVLVVAGVPVMISLGTEADSDVEAGAGFVAIGVVVAVVFALSAPDRLPLWKAAAGGLVLMVLSAIAMVAGLAAFAWSGELGAFCTGLAGNPAMEDGLDVLPVTVFLVFAVVAGASFSLVARASGRRWN